MKKPKQRSPFVRWIKTQLRRRSTLKLLIVIGRLMHWLIERLSE